MTARHALQHILHVGVRLDVVKLCSRKECCDDGPAVGAPVRAGEEMVLAPERDRADGTLDRVGIEFDAAVVEEAAESLLPSECVSDCFGQTAAPWHAVQLAFEPRAHGVSQALVRLGCSRISANQSVRADVPDVAEPCDGRPLDCRHLVRRIGLAGLCFQALDQNVDLGHIIEMNGDSYRLKQSKGKRRTIARRGAEDERVRDLRATLARAAPGRSGSRQALPCQARSLAANGCGCQES